MLLPGDPGRALLLAQTLLSEPRMFNHHRGLWGYTGTAADGELLTIQSTGMGGPSAAIVIAELADLGAVRLVRVGTCGALSSALALGELLVADEAVGADGASRTLTGGASRGLALDTRTRPDPALTRALSEAGERLRRCIVVSTDLFYDSQDGQEQTWLQAGIDAVDMETATLYALARRRRLQAASLLLVTDLILPSRVRIDPDQLHDGERRLGQVALAALAADATTATAG